MAHLALAGGWQIDILELGSKALVIEQVDRYLGRHFQLR